MPLRSLSAVPRSSRNRQRSSERLAGVGATVSRRRVPPRGPQPCAPWRPRPGARRRRRSSTRSAAMSRRRYARGNRRSCRSGEVRAAPVIVGSFSAAAAVAPSSIRHRLVRALPSTPRSRPNPRLKSRTLPPPPSRRALLLQQLPDVRDQGEGAARQVRRVARDHGGARRRRGRDRSGPGDAMRLRRRPVPVRRRGHRRSPRRRGPPARGGARRGRGRVHRPGPDARLQGCPGRRHPRRQQGARRSPTRRDVRVRRETAAGFLRRPRRQLQRPVPTPAARHARRPALVRTEPRGASASRGARRSDVLG